MSYPRYAVPLFIKKFCTPVLAPVSMSVQHRFCQPCMVHFFFCFKRPCFSRVIYVLIFSLGQKMLKLCCPFSGKVRIKNFLLFSIRAIFPLFQPLFGRKMPSLFVCFFFLIIFFSCLMNCKLKKKNRGINNFWYPYSIYHFWSKKTR